MDVLNLISWIKTGNYRATLPTDVPNLLPIGAKDPSRDDGYLPLAVNAAPLQTLYNSGNVTQTPLINSGVTVNGLNGIITTVPAAILANAKTSFTVTNSNVKTTSKILVSVDYSELATGIPVVGVARIQNGNFKIVLSNGAGSAPLNAIVKIHYLIIV
ncbi:MAG: hypothetical protein NTY55_03000 [Flavobacteriia bacterium]|nr:hypothetical protein [Flavobacteriia bacterium]